jgi:hypothetical protein
MTGKIRIADFATIGFKSMELLSTELRLSDKSRLLPTKNRVNVKKLKMIVNGIVDRGCELPTARNNSLISNPTNIKNAILKPAENNTMSTKLIFFNLRILRRTNPGTNER